MSKIDLYCADAILKMKELIAEGVKVDAIIIDPPYGQTPLKWDSTLPFNELWECMNQIKKDASTPIIIFGQEPFSSFVRMSNIELYKYDWYWKKERLTNVFQVKRRPGKIIENIMVFYDTQCTYNPQKTIHNGPKRTNKVGDKAKFSETQSGQYNVKPTEYNDDGTRYPLQLIECNRDSMYDTRYHPTQKPLELMEILVKTYTKPGDTVLDFVMGSGTTALACIKNNRNCIGIDNNNDYFNIANKRIEEYKQISTE